VALVGGGNSAGQAIVFLAGHAAKVTVLLRGPGLQASMSRYLIDRIAALPNVELIPNATVEALVGEPGALTAVQWRDRRTGEVRTVRASHLFSFIGAEPNTDWLADSCVTLDGKGFVVTDPAGPGGPLNAGAPGVFAIGDVRAGSTKRLSAAVGEGAQAAAALSEYLANLRAVPEGVLASS
jgi:thioredoxin reductase (NADPH)